LRVSLVDGLFDRALLKKVSDTIVNAPITEHGYIFGRMKMSKRRNGGLEGAWGEVAVANLD